MNSTTWQDEAFKHDMVVRKKLHQRGLNNRAHVAAEMEVAGFELLDEVDVVLHANESNAICVVVGHIIKNKSGQKLFRDRDSNQDRKYDPDEVEKFKRKRLEELENR